MSYDIIIKNQQKILLGIEEILRQLNIDFGEDFKGTIGYSYPKKDDIILKRK